MIVIIALLDHGQQEDEYQRGQECEQEPDTERLKKLRERDPQEEDVEEELELVHQNQGDEREY